MPVTAPEWLFDISFPAKTGLLKSIASKVYATAPSFFRNQTERRTLRFVVPSNDTTLWTPQTLTGATIIVAIGEPDAAPTAGTFTLTFGADTTTALSYAATSAQVVAALNALASITAAGGVTGSKEAGALYTITFNTVGARAAMTGTATGLTPLSSVVVETDTEGDVGTAEIQTIQLVQQYLAYSSAWTPDGTTATGTLAFNRLALRQKFANTTAQTIEETMEVKLAFPGEALDVVYHQTVTLARDLINAAGVGASITAGLLTDTTGIAFKPAIVGYTGGGSTKLDGIVTTSLSVNRIVAFIEATDGLRLYALVAGTDAEASPNVIRPDDYHATTNAKVWKSAL